MKSAINRISGKLLATHLVGSNDAIECDALPCGTHKSVTYLVDIGVTEGDVKEPKGKDAAGMHSSGSSFLGRLLESDDENMKDATVVNRDEIDGVPAGEFDLGHLGETKIGYKGAKAFTQLVVVPKDAVGAQVVVMAVLGS